MVKPTIPKLEVYSLVSFVILVNVQKPEVDFLNVKNQNVKNPNAKNLNVNILNVNNLNVENPNVNILNAKIPKIPKIKVLF